MTQIPKKLNKCPLVDVIFEIRFNPIVPPEVVFPMIYSRISNDFGPIESLPVSQIPAQTRESDPNLEFAPLFRLRSNANKNHIIQIGPKVVIWSSSPLYSGWDNFREYVTPLLKTVIQCGVLTTIIRTGFRAVNFFEDTDIFKNKLLVKISLNDSEIRYNQTTLRTELIKDEYHSTVQVMNEAQVNLPASRKAGSIIDIDTFNVSHASTSEDIIRRLDIAHDIEKEAFFSLLKDDFLKTLEPEY